MKNWRTTFYQILVELDLSKIKELYKVRISYPQVQNTLLGPSAQILFDDGSNPGMFVSDFVADPKSTLETFNSLSVTPAALLADRTRTERRLQRYQCD
jgi:hypothetical protein